MCFGFIFNSYFVLQSEEICDKKGYVIGTLQGQLGNQLFQIAATISLALDHDAIAIFPDLLTEEKGGITQNYRTLFYRLNATNPIEKINYEYSEPYYNYCPITYHPNMKLTGFFQSEKYFKHHKNEILQIFEPSSEINQYLETRYDEIINHPKTVSLHIRTYKDAAPGFHHFVGWNYVHKALKVFDRDFLVVVFSDDIEFARKNLKPFVTDKQMVFVDEAYFHAIYLMSKCKNNIIANSSFSWWGAYLNKNPEKIVICPSPKRWVGPKLSHLNTKDLIPSEWVILD